MNSSNNQANIADLLDALAFAPQKLLTASRKLNEKQLNFRPETNAWSISEILVHLRACADVWGASIRAMLDQNHPTLRYISPRSWMRKSGYLDLAFGDSLKGYQQQRRALLAELKSLTPRDWLRGATFTATVRGREQTVASYVQRIIDHERAHCEQLDALINGMPRGLR